MKPLVSICIPTFNRGHILAETLESYIHQTYKSIEIIVVSDGCTDSTPVLMDYYTKKDKRIKYIYRKENKGIAFTRNEAIDHSLGDYICVGDSDDLAHMLRVEKSVKAIKNADFVYSSYYQANEHAEIQGIVEPPKKLNPKAINDVLEGAWPHVTIMARSFCFIDNPYRSEFRVNDDAGLCLDFYKSNYVAKKIDEPLMIVRYHKGSVSATRDKEVKDITNKLRLELYDYENSRTK